MYNITLLDSESFSVGGGELKAFSKCTELRELIN